MIISSGTLSHTIRLDMSKSTNPSFGKMFDEEVIAGLCRTNHIRREEGGDD